MNEAIDTAINKMAEMTKAAHDADKALKYSQSALNLANTKAVLTSVEASSGKPAKKQGTGAT